MIRICVFIPEGPCPGLKKRTGSYRGNYSTQFAVPVKGEKSITGYLEYILRILILNTNIGAAPVQARAAFLAFLHWRQQRRQQRTVRTRSSTGVTYSTTIQYSLVQYNTVQQTVQQSTVEKVAENGQDQEQYSGHVQYNPTVHCTCTVLVQYSTGTVQYIVHVQYWYSTVQVQYQSVLQYGTGVISIIRI